MWERLNLFIDRQGDRDLFQQEIDEHLEKLEHHVERSKPITDFLQTLVWHSSITAVIYLLLPKLFSDQATPTLIFALIVCVTLWLWLFQPLSDAVHNFTDIITLTIIKYLPLRHGFNDSHLLISALWDAFMSTIRIVMYWGVTMTIAELMKVTVLK